MAQWGALEWALLSLLIFLLAVVLGIFVLLLYLYWRRRARDKPLAGCQASRRRPPPISMPHVEAGRQGGRQRDTKWPSHVTHRRVPVTEFGTRLHQLLNNDRVLLRAEFHDINDMADDVRFGTVKLSPAIVSDQNMAKNRFTDILPSESTRVKLKGTKSDYINASHIRGPINYIAAQGPMDAAEALLQCKMSTVDDFWQMIWQQNVRKIVNLTNCEENLRRKSSAYWSEFSDRPLTFGTIFVRLIEATHDRDIIMRTMLVSQGDETRTVTQWHCSDWGDYGAMEPQRLLDLRAAIFAQPTDGRAADAPVLVHCSAGVGRTGTFIALDMIARQLEDGAHAVDVMHTVHTLRRQRVRMVQTLRTTKPDRRSERILLVNTHPTQEQYAMLYKCVGLLIEQRLCRYHAGHQRNVPSICVTPVIEDTGGIASIASTSGYDNPTLVDSSGATTDSDVNEMNI